MTSSTAESEVPTDRCYRCDYDLRGIADERACPECGLLALRSRRASDDIRSTHPKELRSLSRGIWLLLLAFVVAVFPPLVECTAGAISGWSPRILNAIWNLRNEIIGRFGASAVVYTIADQSGLFLLDIAAILFVAGALIISRRDTASTTRPTQADRWFRLALRITSFVPLVCILLKNSLEFAVGSVAVVSGWQLMEWQTHDTLDEVIFYFFLFCSAPFPALLMFRLREIARRSRSAHLAEHCAIVGIGTSLSMLYSACATYVLMNAGVFGLPTSWGSRGLLSLLVGLISSTAPAMFGLWSIYLLARLAIRFRVIAKERANLWRREDSLIAAS